MTLGACKSPHSNWDIVLTVVE